MGSDDQDRHMNDSILSGITPGDVSHDEFIKVLCFEIRSALASVNGYCFLLQNMLMEHPGVDSLVFTQTTLNGIETHLSLADIFAQIEEIANEIMTFEAIADAYAFVKLRKDDAQWWKDKLESNGITQHEFSRWLSHSPGSLILAIVDEIAPRTEAIRRYWLLIHNHPKLGTISAMNSITAPPLRSITRLMNGLDIARDYAIHLADENNN